MSTCKRCGWATFTRQHVEQCAQEPTDAVATGSPKATVNRDSAVTRDAAVTQHACPECGAQHEVRRYGSSAERQRAYRGRKA